MELVAALKKDHKTLKALYNEGLKKKTTLARKKAIYKKLAVLVPAHAQSEESALYANVEDVSKISHYAFEGFEEHHLVDQLLQEMKDLDNPHQWEAKFTVVCEMLQHHIKEEEEDFFPEVTRLISRDVRILMGEEYTRLFATLSKKPEKPATEQSFDVQTSQQG